MSTTELGVNRFPFFGLVRFGILLSLSLILISEVQARPKLKELPGHQSFGGVLSSEPKEGETLRLLGKIESVALRGYPELLAGKQEVTKAQQDQRSAQGSFLDPLLKLSTSHSVLGKYENSLQDLSVVQATPLFGATFQAGYRHAEGAFPEYDAKLLTGSSGEWRVGFELPLLRNSWTDARRTRVESAGWGVRSAQASLELKELETLRGLRLKFWSWVSENRKWRIQQELLQLAQVREKQLSESVRLGEAPEIDLSDNRRAVLQRSGSVVSAERSAEKAKFELSVYFRSEEGQMKWVGEGLDSERPTFFPLVQSLSEEQERTDGERSQREHPEVVRLQALLENAEVDYRLSQNQVLPKLDVSMGYHAELGQTATTQSSEEMRAALLFEYPLFNRAAQGKAEAQFSSREKAELALQLARDRLRIDLRNQAQSIRATSARIELAQLEVKEALRLEEAERARFAHGMSNLFLINLREQSTAEALVREASALEAHFQAWADYQFTAAIVAPSS